MRDAEGGRTFGSRERSAITCRAVQAAMRALLLAFLLLAPARAAGDVTEQRSHALVLNHIAHSWPKCETGAHWGEGSACWMLHFYSIMADEFPNATLIATSNATRTHGTNLSFANSEIRRLIQDQVPANGAVGIPYYSAVPLALRLYFRAAPSRLEPATRRAGGFGAALAELPQLRGARPRLRAID